MKNPALISIWLVGVFLGTMSFDLFAQNPIVILITVKEKDSQFNLKGLGNVTISYHDANKGMVGVGATTGEGVYNLDLPASFKRGGSIRIYAHKDGYIDVDSLYFIKLDENQLELTMVKSGIPAPEKFFSIEFEVKSTENEVVKDADIYVRNLGKEAIKYTFNTDERGHFQSKRVFKQGDTIIVTAKKNNYLSSLPDTILCGRDSFVTFFLKESKKIGLWVRDGQSHQALNEVEILCQSEDGSSIEVTPTKAKGYYLLEIPASSELVIVQASKQGYIDTDTLFYTLLNERPELYMWKGAGPPPPPIAEPNTCRSWKWKAYSTIGLTAASGASYIWYDKSYQRYKNYKNPDREKDYNRAKTLLRTGTVVGAWAIGLGVIWLMCECQKGKDNKAGEKKTELMKLRPLFTPDALQGIQVGIAYKF